MIQVLLFYSTALNEKSIKHHQNPFDEIPLYTLKSAPMAQEGDV